MNEVEGMTTETRKSPSNMQHNGQKPNRATAAVQDVEKDIQPFQAFINKFNNDWVMNFAGMLAYNLILSIFPIIIAIASIIGLVLGNGTRGTIVKDILHVLPNKVSPDVLTNVLDQLSKNSGFLGIVAIILALFFGSRLFIVIEGCFDIIYHVRPRTLIPQNLMALGMLLIFVVLIPIMVFASSIPALAVSLLKYTFIGTIPFLASVAGILGGLIVSFVLFEAIYFVVPNQRISFRHSWLGALGAAIALELYLTLFPLYVQHFLNGYAGQVGFAIVLLVFFYYFAVILLLGAELNAFFSERVQPLPNDLATFVSTMGGKLNKDIPNVESASHQNTRPTDRADARHITEARSQERQTQKKNVEKQLQVAATGLAEEKAKTKEKASKGPSKLPAIIEVITGSALAVVIELFRLRQRGR
jgi:YihY family inner membrane protein